MNKAFIDCGLVLHKCVPKKTQSYFKKQKITHIPYFCKLDDRGYDFTVERLNSLQKVNKTLQTELLKLDVTIDCEGCFYLSKLDQINESALGNKLATLGFKPRRDYNQLPTCVCFERGDAFVTIYNKPI